MGELVKVHKLTVMILDFEEMGADEVVGELENGSFPNDCISPYVMDVQTRDIGEWSDDHPLNRNDTAAATFNLLFAP